MKNFDAIEKQLRQRLQTLSPSFIKLVDESALHVGHQEAHNGAHVRLEIVSDKFFNQSLLKRHRLIFDAIGDLPNVGVHALTIKAFALDELSTLTETSQ